MEKDVFIEFGVSIYSRDTENLIYFLYPITSFDWLLSLLVILVDNPNIYDGDKWI